MNNFEFEKVEGGYSLIKYNITEKNEEDVLIPESFQGEPVVEIGERAFSESIIVNKSHITSISIPNTVRKIGAFAFCGCIKLKKVTLPSELITISEKAFMKCYDLAECVLPDKLEYIGYCAFTDCKEITEVHLPFSLKYVDKHAYCDTRVEKITCYNEKTKFHRDSFFSCHLKEVSFCVIEQLDLEFIGVDFIEYYLAQWETLEIGVKNEAISCTKKLKVLKDGIFRRNDTQYMYYLLRDGLVLSLPELNDYLEFSIKKNNTTVTALLLQHKHENYTKDQLNAQDKHNYLLELGLEPPTLQDIERKWDIIEVEGGLELEKYIGTENFIRIPGVLADGTKILGLSQQCLSNHSVKNIIVEEGVRYLGELCFEYCLKLEEIFLPESLETLGDYVFLRCYALKKVNIPKKVKELPLACFSDCHRLEQVTLPEGMDTINDYAFHECVDLKELILPNSLISMPEGPPRSAHRGVFYDSGITSIIIPPNLTEIPRKAFTKCGRLREITLHENIRKIGYGAFRQAPLLADSQGFIIVKNILFGYYGASNCCVVPDHVIRISRKGFRDGNFNEIVLPEGLLAIEESSFLYCQSLKKITIPRSVKILPDSSFNQCNALEEVVVSSETVVGEKALHYCSLAKIVVN